MRPLLALLIFAPTAWAPSALAQSVGTLAGIVTDSTGTALPGATVFLPQVQRSGATDIDGAYRILDLPVGVYEVRFLSIGLVSKAVVDVEVSPDREHRLDMALPCPSFSSTSL